MPARSKLTPEVQARICDAISAGATYEHAAAYGGIAQSTFYEWVKAKPEFSEALKEAEARGALACLARIRQAADGGVWQAAAWILERRHPRAYGRTVQQVELSGPEGGTIPLGMVDKVLEDAGGGSSDPDSDSGGA